MAPTFAVWAMKDLVSGNLDRVQIVKGWYDTRGYGFEKIYDVGDQDAPAFELQQHLRRQGPAAIVERDDDFIDPCIVNQDVRGNDWQMARTMEPWRFPVLLRSDRALRLRR